MKKWRASIAAAALAILLVGCSKQPAQTITLYESKSVKVERTGAQTVIKDLINSEEYSFTIHRMRIKGRESHYSTAELVNETEVIKLETVYNLIILEDKPQGQTYYIR